MAAITTPQPKTFTVRPAPESHNENTLDKVHYRDFTIDMRTALPAAHKWLHAARPHPLLRPVLVERRPDNRPQPLLRHPHHLHQVEAAHLR
jgi:erythromycin esterase